MAKRDILNENFVNELFKLAMKNTRVFELVNNHIKYNYLPNEHYKEVWKAMSKYFNVSQQLPTVGYLFQQLDDNKDVIEVLSDIKTAELINKDDAVEQFETFLKRAMFMEAYQDQADVFMEGNMDLIQKMVTDLGTKMSSFSIKDRYYDKVYGGFMDRHKQRLADQDTEVKKTSSKVPIGIDEFDDITRGGVDKGDTFMILAQSGVGKSKFMKHVGQYAARRGLKGIHVQAEGTRDEYLAAYDAGISGQLLRDIESANIDADVLEEIKKATANVQMGGGEIYGEAFEQFDTASLADVRALIQDIIKVHGEIDFLLLDYFELFDPGDGKRYKVSEERQRREALANKLKNIAVEFNIAIITATQASTVSPVQLNDPEFVQTRYHVSEFKGVVKPFSYFVTMNQTEDEKNNEFMRLYVDKCRKYRGGQIIKIFQNYGRERFYNRQKTINEIYTPMAA